MYCIQCTVIIILVEYFTLSGQQTVAKRSAGLLLGEERGGLFIELNLLLTGWNDLLELDGNK